MLWRGVVLSLFAALIGSTAAQAQTPTPIDSNVAVKAYAQSRGQDLQGVPCASQGAVGCGGCYPEQIPTGDALTDALNQLNEVNPEWQAIGPMLQSPNPLADASTPPDSVPVRIEGVVEESHAGGVDFPGTHGHPDQNTYVLLDSADNSYSATGNDTASVMALEWESDKYPTFAWAGEGDRIIAEGRWIFDCGHPGPSSHGKCSNNASQSCNIDSECTSPGTCTNPAPNFTYASEMHPPHAVAVLRNRSIGKTPATQADIYISADGGGAGDRCNATHLASALDVLFAKDCFKNHCSVTTSRSCRLDKDCAYGETCITLDPANRLANINAGDFEFDMPLPTPPSGSPSLRIIKKSFRPRGGIMPLPILTQVGLTALHVKVPMTTLFHGKTPNVFAYRIQAAWKKDPTVLKHVQVKFKSLTINNPLKEVVPAFPAGCTLPTGGGFIDPLVPCTSDADCPAGIAQNAGRCAIDAFTGSGKACHRDSDCVKKEYCMTPSQCYSAFVPGWEMFGEVNGAWVTLKGLDDLGAKKPYLAPPYPQPAKPLTIAENFRFDDYVPADGTVHVKLTGHSWGCIAQANGRNLKDSLNTVGLLPGAACLLAQGWSPGNVEITHTGPDFTSAPGCTTIPGKPTICTVTSSGDGGTCSADPTRLCVTDSDCASGTCTQTGGAYTLQYTIAVLR